MKLNEHQRNAVEAEGHVVVTAGPGTGKTATLVARVVYLVETGVEPEEILVFTFTRKAAEELRGRIENALVTDKLPFVGTIHGWCDWWLRTFTSEWGNKVLINTEEQSIIVKNLVKELEQQGSSDTWVLHISNQRVGKSRDAITELYEKRLSELDYYDFDDLLIETEKHLSEKWPDNFSGYSHVMVDEFQDVNCLQYNIVRHLLSRRSGVGFIVGDPRQGIYRFRGGSSQWMYQYVNDFSDKKITSINLDISYRCTQQILNVSGQLFSQNIELQSYARKPMHATMGTVFHINTLNERTEAYWIRKKIEYLIGGIDERETISNYINFHNIGFSQIAIFYRSYQTVSLLAKELHGTPLPFRVYGEKKFVEYKDVDVFLNVCRAITDGTYRSILSKIQTRLVDELVQNSSTHFKEGLLQLIEVLKFPHNKRCERFVRISHEWEGEKFLMALPSFINAIAMLDEADEYNPSVDQISIMSLHASKGLEFDVAFIIGCEEGLLPHSKAIETDDREDIEEERRLLYVGITRARLGCYLFTAKTRSVFGVGQQMKESRFIEDLRRSSSFCENKDELAQRFANQKAKRLSKKQERERQQTMF